MRRLPTFFIGGGGGGRNAGGGEDAIVLTVAVKVDCNGCSYQIPSPIPGPIITLPCSFEHAHMIFKPFLIHISLINQHFSLMARLVRQSSHNFPSIELIKHQRKKYEVKTWMSYSHVQPRPPKCTNNPRITLTLLTPGGSWSP